MACQPFWRLCGDGPSAEFVECRRERPGDLLRVAVLDLASLEHVQQLAVSKQSDRGRRRRVAGEVAAGTIGGVDVGAREDGRDEIRTVGVTERHGDARTRLAGGAPANRV